MAGVLGPLIRVHSYPKIRVLLAVWGLVDPPLYVEQARYLRGRDCATHFDSPKWRHAEDHTWIDCNEALCSYSPRMPTRSERQTTCPRRVLTKRNSFLCLPALTKAFGRDRCCLSVVLSFLVLPGSLWRESSCFIKCKRAVPSVRKAILL